MKNSTRLLLAASAAFSLAGLAPAQTPVDRAVDALKHGDLAAAEDLLTPLASGDHPDAAAVHELSLVRLRQGRTLDGIALAERAAQLDPARADYQSQLGIAIGQRMGEISFIQQAMYAGRMRRAFEQSVALDPHHLPGLIGLSRYFSNAPAIAGGDMDKARAFATRIREIVPFLGELELGRVAEKDDDADTALQHYEAAARLAPQEVEPLVLAGHALASLGRKDEARARFAAALEIAPNLAAAKSGLAALDAPPKTTSADAGPGPGTGK